MHISFITIEGNDIVHRWYDEKGNLIKIWSHPILHIKVDKK